jgi:hypothetical protein
MPSKTEMRCWVLVGLALLWGGFLWIIWEWWHFAAPASATLAESLAQIRHAQRSVERSFWGTLVATMFGMLAVTRFAWCWLRQGGEG